MDCRLICLLFLTGIIASDRYYPVPERWTVTREMDILYWDAFNWPDWSSDRAFRKHNFTWPNGEIPVHFHSSVSASEKRAIEEAMEEFHQKTCIHFIEADDNHTDFVLIVNPRFSRCGSHVGRQGGKQQLNLGTGCYHRWVILHELMHVLGFIHEHNRYDRDEYVTINWNNTKKEEERSLQKNWEDIYLPQDMETPYDYNSIMHFEQNAYSKDGSPTIIPKREVKVGGGNHLSPIDILKINEYYGCGSDFETKEQEQSNQTNMDQLTISEGSPNMYKWFEQQQQRYKQEREGWNKKLEAFRQKMDELSAQMTSQLGK